MSTFSGILTRARGVLMRTNHAYTLARRLRVAAPDVDWIVQSHAAVHGQFAMVFGFANPSDQDFAKELVGHLHDCVVKALDVVDRQRASTRDPPHFFLLHAPTDQLQHRCYSRHVASASSDVDGCASGQEQQHQQQHQQQQQRQQYDVAAAAAWHWHPSPAECVGVCTLPFEGARGMHLWIDDSHVDHPNAHDAHNGVHVDKVMDTLCSLIDVAVFRRRTNRTVDGWCEGRVAAVPCSRLVSHAWQRKKSHRRVQWIWWPVGQTPRCIDSDVAPSKPCSLLTRLSDALPANPMREFEDRVDVLQRRLNWWTRGGGRCSQPGPVSVAQVRKMLRELLEQCTVPPSTPPALTHRSMSPAVQTNNGGAASATARRRAGGKRRLREPAPPSARSRAPHPCLSTQNRS